MTEEGPEGRDFRGQKGLLVKSEVARVFAGKYSKVKNE